MNSKDEIFSYGVILGKRFTNREKKKFLLAAQTHFKRLQMESDIVKSELKVDKKRKITHYNLYTCNIKEADIIVATYYDTASKNISNSPVYAFNDNSYKKNHIIQLISSLIILLVITCIAYFYIFPKVQFRGVFSFWGIFSILYLLLSYFVIKRISQGFANRYNFIKNTSSILTVFKLVEKRKSNRVAYALIDGGNTTNYGFRMLQNYVKAGSKIIYLDSIGNGEKLQTFKQSDLIRHGLGDFGVNDESVLFLTSGSVEGGKVEIKNANTSRDKNINYDILMNHVCSISQLISQYLKRKS